jgi:hypothetical protein
MNDELLFGTEPQRGRDSDGDGVSDAQEAVDGTDPNDAADSIRHDDPVVGPTTGDPRDDLEQITLDREVKIDVAAANPSGKSLDQSLPMGLDGKPIPTEHKYGNADADKMLGGHGNENSPLDMKRDPTVTGAHTGATKGHDPVKDTLGRDPGPSVGGEAKSGNGHGTTPPPGAELSFRAPNAGLVSDDNLRALVGVKPAEADPKPKEDPKEKFIKASDQKTDADKLAEWQKKTAPKNYDTGEGGGTVAPTEDELERVVAVHGGATDFVEGHGAGPQIEDTAPPPPKRDLVTDPSPEGDPSSVDITKGPVTPPGGGYTDPTNPRDGFGSPQQPGTGSGGGVGGNTGREGFSSAAMATDSAADTSGGSSDLKVVDSGSTGRGIQTVAGDDVTGMGTSSGTDSDGDGVSDAQEAIDGTDPNDAASSIRHDDPVVGPTTGDPRGDLAQITLDREVKIDVAAANPSGSSLEQTLPMGLDGKPIPTEHKYGNADADKMMGGHGNEDSPLDMERNPAAGNTAMPGGGHETQPHGGGGKTETAGGTGTPPPGTDLGPRAPKGNLVGEDEDDDWAPMLPPTPPPPPGTGSDPPPPPKDDEQKPDPKFEPVPVQVQKDPDADTGGVLVAPRAHPEPRVVEGYGGGPQIEEDAPPLAKGGLVTDPSPEGDPSSVDITKGPVTPPGGGYTDPTNPRDGFGPPQQPGAEPGSGVGGNTGREGFSSADTATDASADSSGGSSELRSVNGPPGDGIQTVTADDVTGLSAPPATGSTDRESQSSAMKATDPSGSDSTGGGTGSYEEPDATPVPVAMVADEMAPVLEIHLVDGGVAIPVEILGNDITASDGIIIPDTDRPVMIDGFAAPLDPIADAMTNSHVALHEAPGELFAGLQIDDAAAIPDEVDLDDGF